MSVPCAPEACGLSPLNFLQETRPSVGPEDSCSCLHPLLRLKAHWVLSPNLGGCVFSPFLHSLPRVCWMAFLGTVWARPWALSRDRETSKRRPCSGGVQVETP